VEVNEGMYIRTHRYLDTMRRILVPTDFSEAAFSALQYAIGLSNDIGGEVVVVHAFGTPATGSAVMMNIQDTLLENANQELKQLESKVGKLSVQPKNALHYKAMEGSISEAINALTDSDLDELVVMGTDGEVDLAEQYFGSHTAATAKTADVPLLAVPVNFSYQAIKRILVASDGRPVKTAQSISYITDLAKLTDAEIDVVRIEGSDSAKEEVTAAELVNQLKERVNKEIGHHVHVHKKVDQGIHEMSASKKCDIVAVFQRKHNFLEALLGSSVTKRMVNGAKLPVLVLRG